MAPAGPCSFFTRSPRCEPGAAFLFSVVHVQQRDVYKRQGLYHASPLDSAIEAVPVSFHGQLRKNVYTGSCDIPGVLQCCLLYTSRVIHS